MGYELSEPPGTPGIGALSPVGCLLGASFNHPLNIFICFINCDSILNHFLTIFGSIFGRFSSIFEMHFCIQFLDRLLIGFGMLFSSEVKMFHHVETLKKLISPQFLQCFVNVTLFRMRTETTDTLLWNAKKKTFKNR